MGIPEGLKAALGLKHKDRYLISAEEARAISLYGTHGQRDRYLIDRLEEYSVKIREAAKLGNFAVIERITKADYRGILSDIMDHFKEVGYGVKLLDSTDIPEVADDKFLIIAWKTDEKLSGNVDGRREEVLDI